MYRQGNHKRFTRFDENSENSDVDWVEDENEDSEDEVGALRGFLVLILRAKLEVGLDVPQVMLNQKT